MAKLFIVRVVLHPEHQNHRDIYKLVHDEMQRKGYVRVVQGDSGRFWKLPSATYHSPGLRDTVKSEQVRDYVQTVVKTALVDSDGDPLHITFAVHVDERTGSSAWSDLEEISETVFRQRTRTNI